MTQANSLISTNALSKIYGSVLGVNDISITLPPGVHGLLGPNGAGKSTLIKLSTGQLRPNEGTIHVLDEVPWNNHRLFQRLGYCAEHDGFYGFLTAREFVRTFARVGGMSKSDAEDRAAESLEFLGAHQFMDRKIRTFSKGMRQRTKLAAAIVHDPEFLILDEPLSGLDPVGRADITTFVKNFAARGKSVLISSHVLHEVQAITSNFLLIYAGRIQALGHVKEIRALLDKFPHQIRLKCDEYLRLAQGIMRNLPIIGLEIFEAERAVSVKTNNPREFHKKLPELILELQVHIETMDSQDDNLEAIFHYLLSEKL